MSVKGEVVAWEVFSGLEVPYATVKGALVKSGLDEEVARGLLPRTAFTRAMKKLVQKRLVRFVERLENGDLVYQITEEGKKGLRLDYNYVAQVRVHGETGKVFCLESADLEQKIQDELDRALGVRTSGDVGKVVKELFTKNVDLFPIAPKGRAYYVPEHFGDFTNKVHDFLTWELKAGNLFRLSVGETEESKETLKTVVQRGLEQILKGHEEAIAQYDEDTREGTVERAVERLQETELKVLGYAAYLEGAKDELLEKLQGLKDTLKAKLHTQLAEVS